MIPWEWKQGNMLGEIVVVCNDGKEVIVRTDLYSQSMQVEAAALAKKNKDAYVRVRSIR